MTTIMIVSPTGRNITRFGPDLINNTRLSTTYPSTAVSIQGTPQTFTKPVSSGGGSAAPYTLLSGVTIPTGATYAVMTTGGWSQNPVTVPPPPTLGGNSFTSLGRVFGYASSAPVSQMFELPINQVDWGTSVDLVLPNDSLYSFVQHGYLLFHNGGAARGVQTFRTDVDGSDMDLTLTDAQQGDLTVLVGTSRNTAAAAITYLGNGTEVVTNHWPNESQQFSIHSSYLQNATTGQQLGGSGVLSAGGGGTVDWRSFIATTIRPAN